jgi:hypothetical protein
MFYLTINSHAGRRIELTVAFSVGSEGKDQLAI